MANAMNIKVADLQDVIYEVHDGVARITINRPKTLNAVTPRTACEMTACFDDAKDNSGVGVVVLTGIGERSFCSGGDVNWEATEEFESDIGIVAVKEQYAAMRDCLKPIIARVNGYAIGGGHHLQYMCDFAIAADHAIFGQNGPRVASPAEGWLVTHLSRVVGLRRAKEIWMLCRRYSAAQAYEWGLVNAVVSMEELDAEVDKWCQELLALSPTVLKLIKKSFDDEYAGVREQLDRFSLREVINPNFFPSGEHDEGARAFTEKRAPDFSKWR